MPWVKNKWGATVWVFDEKEKPSASAPAKPKSGGGGGYKTNRYGGPKGTKKDAAGRAWSDPKHARHGGSASTTPTAKGGGTSAAERKALEAARRKELDRKAAKREERAVKAAQRARQREIEAAVLQEEARAAEKQRVAVAERFAAAQEKVRNRRRRLARLQGEDVAGRQLDALAEKLRIARERRNARREAYESIAWQAQVARTKLQQRRDVQKRDPEGKREDPEYVDPHLVLGRDEEGNKDKSLEKRAILDEIKAIRKRQREAGGNIVDQQRLKILDARLDWIVSRLSSRLSTTIKEAERLEQKAIAGDRQALGKLEALLEDEETKKIFKQREFFFGRKPGDVGEFDRYYSHRRVISNRYNEYWTEKLESRSANQWHAQNARARSSGLLQRNLIANGVAKPEDFAPDVPGARDRMPLNPDGSWWEAPPEEVAKFVWNNLVDRAIEVIPGADTLSQMWTDNRNKRRDLHSYAYEAGVAEGILPEDSVPEDFSWRFTDPQVVDKVVDAATRQFKIDWEKKNGSIGDEGLTIGGFDVLEFTLPSLNISTASDPQKKRAEEYRMEEEAFRNSMYQLYQDRKAPGMIEGLLNEWVAPKVLPIAELGGAAWGGFWSGMTGYGVSTPTEPPTREKLLAANNKEELIAAGVPDWMLTRTGDDFNLKDQPAEVVDEMLATSLQYGQYGQNVAPGLNILNPSTWLGGNSEEEARTWAFENQKEYDLPLDEFEVDGKFNKDKFRAWLKENKDVQRQYFTEWPSEQGLIVAPEDQINANPDSVFTASDGLGGLLGFKQDTGETALKEGYEQQKELSDRWNEADILSTAPGTSALDNFWEQVRVLNEAPNLLQREPGGGAIATSRMASMVADPLMLLSPGRLARIFQYGISQGDGFLGKGLLISKELYNNRLGFSIPGQRRFWTDTSHDAVGRWQDYRGLSKDLRKSLADGEAFTDKQMNDLLEQYVGKTGVDPIVAAKGDGMMDFLKYAYDRTGKAFSPEKVNAKQLQAATERFMKRTLAREGYEVIERADQAALLRRTTKLRNAADAEDAAAARSQADEAAEMRQRKAVRDAEALRQSKTSAKKRSVFEAKDDFVDDVAQDANRAPGDFRSPVTHEVRGGYGVHYYRKGLRKVKDSANVYAVGTTRHAEDIIALADGIARRYGLGVRWIRNPKGIAAGKANKVAELFGGTPEQMAKAADELDILMRKHRLGNKTKNSTFRAVDPSDGRVLYRDTFEDSAREAAAAAGKPEGIADHRLLEKMRLRRAQLKKLKTIKNKELVRELDRLQSKIDDLGRDRFGNRIEGSIGDPKLAAEQARLTKEMKKIEAKIQRVERLEDRIVERQRRLASDATNGIGPLDVAQQELLIKQLKGTRSWIDSQLRRARLRLAKQPNNKRLKSYIDWLEQARLGQRLLMEDVAGPVAVAKRVVGAHGDEATFLQKASDVAPIVPAKPPGGLSQKQYGLMDIGRGLRARLKRMHSYGPVGGAESTKALQAWQTKVGKAARNQLKLPEFGIDVNGFDNVMPVLRALRRMDYYGFEKHPQIAKWIELQVRWMDPTGKGIKWKKVAKETGVDIRDEFDKLEALQKLHTQEISQGLDVSYDAMRALDTKVTEAVRDVTGGIRRPYTRTSGPRRYYEEFDEDLIGVTQPADMRDYDIEIVLAKAQALEGTGWTVEAYDQARAVLTDTLVKEKRMEVLTRAARARAKKEGISFEDAMKLEREAFARELSDEKLRRFAMESPYGLSDEEVWDDFVRSTVDDQLGVGRTAIEVNDFQLRVSKTAVQDLTGVNRVLDDAEWARGINAIAPSQTFASDARNFLVDMGHWTPKVANDIREGQRVWSAADEAQFYIDNYGFKPIWADADELLKRGAFDSEYQYAKVMTELGVWDNTVDLELRLSSLDADSQQLRILWGDEANNVKALRSIEDQRKWMAERWEGTVFRQPTKANPRGYFTRVPWLMDPSSREYARWLSDATIKYVDDASLMGAKEARRLSRVIQQRSQFNLNKLRAAAASGDGAVLEQELLRQNLKLTDDLLANPTYKKMFSLREGKIARNNPAFALLSGLGYIQRLNTITQMAFGFINAFEVSVAGYKNWLARMHVRRQGGVGLSDVPEFIHRRFPDIESTGMGAGTTIWDRVGSGNFGRAGEALDRLKDPTRSLRDVADLTVGSVKGLPEIGLMVSARAEQSLKLQMFKRLYTDRFSKFLDDGMSEVQADLLARKIAADLTNGFFPSMEGASWWYKALNEVVPFLHYNFATTTLYAKEFLAAPWIIPKMEYLGQELERVNREIWEAENPGLPYPRGSAGSKLNIKVGDTTFVIDFLGMSDVARGSRFLTRLTDGTTMTVTDWMRQFIRVPHPWQAQVYSYLMDQPSWYTGEKVTLGDIVWPVGVMEWYRDSVDDGTINESDWFKLMSRAMFFSEAQSLNPMQSMEQAYFALTTDDAKRKFLIRFPELKEYWAQKDPSSAKAILENNGVLPKSFWNSVSPEVATATDAALANYDKLRSEWDEKLQSYLDAGGSPLDQAYKDMRNERFEALSDYRNGNIYLYNRNAFYNDPRDWDERVKQDFRDSLYDKWQSFDKFLPQEADYKDPVKYQQALVDYYELKGEWLEAHPELMETLGRERTNLELAVADVYEEMGEVYDSIGKRNLEIAKAEAKGKDRLVSALHGVNELRYEQLEDTTVVKVDRQPPLEVQSAIDRGDAPADVERAIVGPDHMAAIVSIPGAVDQKYRDASPEERKEIRRDFWYREAIQQVFEASDSGSDFIERLNSKPALKREYLARLKESDPAAYANWMDRDYYHSKLDKVMAKIKATGDWSHWWTALEGDKRFRQYYMRTHPDKYSGRFDSNMRQFKKMGAIVKAAEASGDWSKFWTSLRKDKKLREWWLSQEPGRRAKWKKSAAYYAKLSPVVQRAVRTGDWGEFNKLLRSDKAFREQYFANNPDKKQAWLQSEAYGAAMTRWQRIAKKNPEKGQDYFASLPGWMQKRFYRSSPKAAATASSNAYTRAMSTWGSLFDSKGAAAAMRYFHSLPASIRNQYYASHPGQREKFAQNDAYGASMKKWVSFFQKDDYDGAEKYFNSLPLWMRQRYFQNNPDKKPGPGYSYPVPDWKMDERMAKVLAEFWQEDAAGRARILANNPAFRRYFRDRKTGGSEARRAMILAGYEALPDDPWLKRVYKERYPEVFSEEADAARRIARVQEFLNENAGIRPAYKKALGYLRETYLESVQGYGVPPKPMTAERLSEEKKHRRRRKEAMRHKGTAEWQIPPNVPKDVPGLVNVLTGKA